MLMIKKAEEKLKKKEKRKRKKETRIEERERFHFDLQLTTFMYVLLRHTLFCVDINIII